MNIEGILKNVGLNEREIRVYLATLELSESTVFPISKKANIKRTYCYDILETLQSKGLVSYFEKNNRRQYTAENPSKIAENLKNNLDDFKAILPDLRAIYNRSPKKPRVRYYEGAEGIITLYNEVLKDKPKELLAISSPHKIERKIGDFFSDYLKKTAENKIHSRDLITKEDLKKSHFSKLINPEFQKVRILPVDVKMSTDTMIYENKIVMISYSDDIHAVVIESDEISASQKMIFEVLWQISRPDPS